jgi:hypothetical protein
MKSSAPQRRDGAEPAPVAEVSSASNQPHPVTGTGERRARIALLAYLRAEERGFLPGYEVTDWLEADRQVDGTLHAGGDARVERADDHPTR